MLYRNEKFKNSSLKAREVVIKISMILALTLAAFHAEAKTPTIRLMDGASVSLIAEAMSLNGVPARVEELTVAKPLAQVIEYYTHRWERDGDVISRQRGGWTVLATRKKDKFISIQLKPQGPHTTVGLVTTTELPSEHSADYSGALSLPQNLKILGWQKHQDTGQVAETITLSAEAPVGHVADIFRQNFLSDRWQISFDQFATTMRDGHVLRLNREGDELDITIGNDPQWSDKTLVYLVWRRNLKTE